MTLDDYDYELPEHLIAQRPAAERTASRLMAVHAGGIQHRQFREISALVRAGDLLVVNDTRVVKARLRGQKPSGGHAELLFERALGENVGLFQVRVSKPLREGGELLVGEHRLTCLGRRGQFYELASSVAIDALLEGDGEVPLPPYIASAEPEDAERYQTVYSRYPGAVAAPTAGLHFDQPLLDELRRAGVGIAAVTLHVGAGTFQPVRGALEDHVMHSEWYDLSAATAEHINATRRRGGRVIAVGTTVVRTLESAALRCQGRIEADTGDTRLFIKPGFRFQVVDALITNFHLPKSTLLMLVSAFAGRDRIAEAYEAAVAAEYRFVGLGDAMWLERA